MLPMVRYRCTETGSPNFNRHCLAGQMPNPPTPISALCGQYGQVSPGDYVVQWEDDGSITGWGATSFNANFVLDPL